MFDSKQGGHETQRDPRLGALSRQNGSFLSLWFSPQFLIAAGLKHGSMYCSVNVLCLCSLRLNHHDQNERRQWPVFILTTQSLYLLSFIFYFLCWSELPGSEPGPCYCAHWCRLSCAPGLVLKGDVVCRLSHIMKRRQTFTQTLRHKMSPNKRRTAAPQPSQQEEEEEEGGDRYRGRGEETAASWFW